MCVATGKEQLHSNRLHSHSLKTRSKKTSRHCAVPVNSRTHTKVSDFHLPAYLIILVTLYQQVTRSPAGGVLAWAPLPNGKGRGSGQGLHLLDTCGWSTISADPPGPWEGLLLSMCLQLFPSLLVRHLVHQHNCKHDRGLSHAHFISQDSTTWQAWGCGEC